MTNTGERLTECDVTGSCPHDLHVGGMTCRDYCGVGVDCDEDLPTEAAPMIKISVGDSEMYLPVYSLETEADEACVIEALRELIYKHKSE